jgi:hypothetical protein
MHKELALAYLKLAMESNDDIISVSFLLKSLEEYALYKIGKDYYSPKIQEEIVNYIRSDKSIYSIYSTIIDEMFSVLLGDKMKRELIERVMRKIIED